MKKSSLDLSLSIKKARKREFLGEMNAVVFLLDHHRSMTSGLGAISLEAHGGEVAAVQAGKGK